MRIALVITSRHASSLGGIGFYTNSILELLWSRGFTVDLILDTPLKNTPFKNIAIAEQCTPRKSLPYTSLKRLMFTHRAPPEIITNAFNALCDTMESRLYDLVYVQSIEMLPGVLQTGIARVCPVLMMSHNSLHYLNTSSPLGELYEAIPNVVKKVTQIPLDSALSEKASLKDSAYLPLVTSEYDLLKNTPYRPEPNTALFNGTFSDNKRPRDFVKFCQYHKLRPKAISNKKGCEFFKEKFSELGIECETRYNIEGEEKVRFIASCEVMFHPSASETMGYAVLEALCFMPVVVYNEPWTEAYPAGILTKINKIEDYIHYSDLVTMDSKGKSFSLNYLNPDCFFNNFLVLIKDVLKEQDNKKDFISKFGPKTIAEYWKEVRKIDSPGIQDIAPLYRYDRSQRREEKDLTYFGDSVRITKINTLEGLL